MAVRPNSEVSLTWTSRGRPVPFASLSKGQLGRLHQSNGSTNLWHETPSRAADLEERPRTLTQPPGSPGANSAGFLVFRELVAASVADSAAPEPVCRGKLGHSDVHGTHNLSENEQKVGGIQHNSS